MPLPYHYLLGVCMQYLKTLLMKVSGGNVPKQIQLLAACKEWALAEPPLSASGTITWCNMKAVRHTDCGEEAGLFTKAPSNLKNTVIFQTVFNCL